MLRSKGLCSIEKPFWFRSQSTIVDFVKRKAPGAGALKSRRWGWCVDVGFGMDLKIPGFTPCDDWWIGLCAEVVNVKLLTHTSSPRLGRCIVN